jgi:methanogenic corrinoid protein MtbC1
VQSCLAFDERDAEDVLAEAFALFPVETVCVEILQQGLNDIGSGWYHDRVSVQQEHFASAQAVRRIDALLTAAPRPTRRQKVLVGCPPGEWHAFPALMLSLLLRRAGIEVIYLGANIAIEQLAETAAVIRPDLIVLAAQQLTTAASLLDTFLVLSRQKIPLAYGGLIFNRIPELAARIPAHFLGESLEGAVSAIERLMQNPQRPPASVAVDDRYRGLARLYQEKRPAIENRLYALLRTGELRVDYLAEANHFLGSELVAALELGDPALLDTDLEWVKHMLAGRRIPADQLKPYLAAYRQAIQAELGPVSAPVTDWMADFIQRNGDARP